MTKITKAQRELLERVAAEPEGAVDTPEEAKLYRPLVKQGLAISLPVSGGWRLIITTAGRALLGGPDAGNRDEAPAIAEPEGSGADAEAPAAGEPPAAEQDGQEAAAEPGEDDGGLESQPASDARDAAEAQPDATPATQTAAAAAKPLPRGKLGKLVELLRRPTGATLEEMVEATCWQAHSVRGAMSGGLKKQRGLTITSTKTSCTRVYRIAAGEPS